jgi:hypothetical protein
VSGGGVCVWVCVWVWGGGYMRYQQGPSIVWGWSVWRGKRESERESARARNRERERERDGGGRRAGYSVV